MDRILEVEPIGSVVKLGCDDDPIIGEITAVCVRSNDYVTYEVTWWSGRDRHQEWLTRAEFRGLASPPQPARIGFRKATP